MIVSDCQATTVTQNPHHSFHDNLPVTRFETRKEMRLKLPRVLSQLNIKHLAHQNKTTTGAVLYTTFDVYQQISMA